MLKHSDALYFNPRPPWGGRLSPLITSLKTLHFNPRPPWGGRHEYRQCIGAELLISIHALRGEDDDTKGGFIAIHLIFQSTPSVGRTTRKLCTSKGVGHNFNPRPPWGGRLCIFGRLREVDKDFNPRPPWGGRHAFREKSERNEHISIHALRGEDDLEELENTLKYFISIHALRGEDDNLAWILYENSFISIHALRGEDDMYD